MEADDISLFFLKNFSPCLFYLLPMITHDAGLSKSLGKIRSLAVVYNAEEEEYFTGEGMGVTNMVQHKVDTSDLNPTSKTSSNKVIIVIIEEVEFCTAFVGGVQGNNICGLMKGDNGSCNKYKTHKDREKVNMDSAFYLTINGTNMFLKPLVSLMIGDSNHKFISQVGEDISKYTAMAVMVEVNPTKNT